MLNRGFLLGPQEQIVKRTSVVRFEDDENEDEDDSYDRLARRTPIIDTSLTKPSSSSLPIITQQLSKPTEKLFAHQFFDVYAGMTDEEWTKVRNAFVAQYFSE
jgi:hypothetical protein